MDYLESGNNGSSVDERVDDRLREAPKDRFKPQVEMGADKSSAVAVISDCPPDRGQTNHYVGN